MREKLVIVPKKRSSTEKMLAVLCLVLACVSLLLSMLNPLIFMIPAVLFAIIWYILKFQSEIEYEYTYYDGDLHFAKIKSKRKRKVIADISMDAVSVIAPQGDRSVYKYENDRNLPCKKLLSGDEGAKVYELICVGEQGTVRYEFEPDMDMLDAIMVKYPRTVIK